jgi:hypothetical protein
MAERLNVNITNARDRKTGAVGEFFAYSGACEVQVAGGHNFSMEFRGMVPGPAVGADPTARMNDAEAKVKAEIIARIEALKTVIPSIKTFNAETPS